MSNSQESSHFELQGEERLGSSLITVPSESLSSELETCKFQWHRIHGVKSETIIGQQLMLTLNFFPHAVFLVEAFRLVVLSNHAFFSLHVRYLRNIPDEISSYYFSF